MLTRDFTHPGGDANEGPLHEHLPLRGGFPGRGERGGGLGGGEAGVGGIHVKSWGGLASLESSAVVAEKGF